MRAAISDRCYELPWTHKDNPNAWIEPTTYCQLKCPGCFRGVDKVDHIPIHLKIDEVKQQIDHFIEKRNIQTISIAGGDPLLYPHLYKLVEYSSSRKLRTMIYTNGIALTRERLGKLKSCGVTQIVIHIDKFQGRTPHESPEELIELRRQYCEMFREVGGVNLGFIQPLTRDCLKDLDKLTVFFNSNRDIISLVVYTLYREICWDHAQKPAIDTSIQVYEVVGRLEELGVFSPAACLASTINKTEPSWTFSYGIGYKDSTLGFLDKKVYRKIQENYYSRKKKYLFISRDYRVQRKSLLRILYFKSIISIFIKTLVHWTQWRKNLYFQSTLVLRGPVKTGKTWDLCKGCPDAMIYKGKQVPSCILEELKLAKNL
jgi:hypothetical protein